VASSASRVEVRTQYPRESRNVSVSVDFTVTVPRGAGVTVRTFSGNLKLATIDGPLTAETISGDVVVTAAGQLESAKSTSGNVRVGTASSEGDLSVSSTSGDVSLKAVRARGVDANSVSGSVQLADVTCTRAKVTSISGEVVFGGPLAKGGRYFLQSHSGDVTVYTDGKSGFEVAAGTFSGEISSDLTIVSTFGGEPPKGEPPAGEPGPGRGPRPKRGGPGQRVRGTFGDGGAFLELSAFSGDVKIVSKTAGTAVKK